MLAGACGNRTHLGPYQGPALRLKRSKIHQDPSAPAIALVLVLVLVVVLELPFRTAEAEDDDENEYDIRTKPKGADRITGRRP